MRKILCDITLPAPKCLFFWEPLGFPSLKFLLANFNFFAKFLNSTFFFIFFSEKGPLVENCTLNYIEIFQLFSVFFSRFSFNECYFVLIFIRPLVSFCCKKKNSFNKRSPIFFIAPCHTFFYFIISPLSFYSYHWKIEKKNLRDERDLCVKRFLVIEGILKWKKN